jgi:hypothetical protein
MLSMSFMVGTLLPSRQNKLNSVSDEETESQMQIDADNPHAKY